TFTGLCFSPDGAWLASAAADGTVRVWETGVNASLPLGVTSEIICPRSIQAVVFSRDGSEILASDEAGLVWSADPRTGERRRTYHGHTDVPYSIALAPDGDHFATCGNDGTLRLWQRARETPQRTIDMRDPACYADPRGFAARYGPGCAAYAPD